MEGFSPPPSTKEVLNMKYYVIKTTKGWIEYKKYKCIDGWSKDKQECWQFSKVGAEKIAKRLNEQCGYEKQSYPKSIHFNILKVGG